MKPYAARKVPKADWELFEEIKRTVEALPPILKGPGFMFGLKMSGMLVSNFIPSCHVVCRALANVFPVVVHDGAVSENRYGKLVRHEHSWLTRKGSSGKVIIDPWPLGSLSGPMLTIQDYCFHYGNHTSYLNHRYSKEFKSQVQVTTREIRKILKKTSPRRNAKAVTKR